MSVPMKVLRDGFKLPVIGFGTSGLKGTTGAHTIEMAISNGYRLIDTAYNYENEGTVGEAVHRSSVPRQQLFISSKLPGRYHEYKQAVTAIQESLYRMNLDYFDLYLIHWPNPKRNLYVEAWQALIDAQRWGLIRSIGVCNFLPEHLEKINSETGVLPVINQIELHPIFSQKKQRACDQEHNILTEAWSPLGGRENRILEIDLIQQLSQKYHKMPAQIVLRWEYQLGALLIPLSRQAKRQEENLNIFDFQLSGPEVQQIIELDQADGRVTNQDPATHEEL